MNPVSARLLNQQLICPQFTAPHEVVRWMGAMQGQDYRMVRWAVGMRTKRPSVRAFARDFDSGRIVRVHLFRTTWQLVAGEDLRWMLDLCRTPALRGLAGWMKSNGISIPREEQERVQTLFTDYLSAHRVAAKGDFDAALRDRGIVLDDHRLSYHIRLGEYAGLLCSGDLLLQKATYALVADKLPGAVSCPRDEALARLARTYFRSHGPATLEDFVWWSGLGIGDCRRGMDALGAELLPQRWRGLDFYIHEESRTRGFRSGGILLLSPYDEYLIGYKSRHVAVRPDLSHRAHNNTGNFWPVVLQDGVVVGNWSSAGGRVAVDVFHPDACVDGEVLQRQIQAYDRFLSR